MGYKRRALHLTFEDKPGLEVYARSLSVGKALDVMQEFGEIDLAQLSTVSKEQMEKLFGAFTERVESWTLEEDDGTPVPVTVAALMDWDLGEAIEILYAWLQQTLSVRFPTTAPAATGAASPVEASIPMSTASATGM